MATIDSCRYSLDRLIQIRAFRNARCYAPEPVISVLGAASGEPDLGLVIDVDALERSALARIDRVMLLALDALAHARVQVYLLARYERQRARLLQTGITGARCVHPGQLASLDLPRIVITDDPAVLAGLREHDRAVALGRPELACKAIASAGDSAVRAILWWLLEERTRALAA